jgi:hypothetical protein
LEKVLESFGKFIHILASSVILENENPGRTAVESLAQQIDVRQLYVEQATNGGDGWGCEEATKAPYSTQQVMEPPPRTCVSSQESAPLAICVHFG